jgi:hypothetical protein
LGHLKEFFLKRYEVDIAQVLESLVTLISRDMKKPKENLAPTSPSNPAKDFPDTYMSLLDDTKQEEHHTELNTVVGKVEEPLLTDQGEENPDNSH